MLRETNASHYFGLVDESQALVAVLALNANEVDHEYAISRYAAKGIIPDGFNTLLQNFINSVKPARIIAVSDNSMPEHTIFRNAGFTIDSFLAADYLYTKDKKRIDKTNFHHAKVQSNPNMVYFESLNEQELAQKNGFTRLWDAGKTQWVLDI